MRHVQPQKQSLQTLQTRPATRHMKFFQNSWNTTGVWKPWCFCRLSTHDQQQHLFARLCCRAASLNAICVFKNVTAGQYETFAVTKAFCGQTKYETGGWKNERNSVSAHNVTTFLSSRWAFATFVFQIWSVQRRQVYGHFIHNWD